MSGKFIYSNIEEPKKSGFLDFDRKYLDFARPQKIEPAGISPEFLFPLRVLTQPFTFISLPKSLRSKAVFIITLSILHQSFTFYKKTNGKISKKSWNLG